MSDAMAKLNVRSKGAVIAAVVVVGVVGICIGRWSRSAASEPQAQSSAGPSSPSSSSSSSGVVGTTGAVGTTVNPASPAPSAPGPQVFDTVEDPNWKAGIPMRDMDRDIFAQLKNDDLDRSKLADLFPDRPYRVRLIGSVTEHRFGLVMIDLNRDGKWDERWDLRAGQVMRNVEHDEGSGGQRVQYTLVHGKWQAH